MSTDVGARGCRKCGQPPYILLDKAHIECQDCFIESCTRKFRQAIGKTKLDKNNDPLLVAYSGGQSSAALLNMIKSRIDSSQRLEPKFRPSIIHVDMQSILCNDDPCSFVPTRASNLDSLLSSLYINYPGWPIYWTSIEMCMKDGSSERRYKTYHGSDSPISSATLFSDVSALSKLREALRQSGDLTEQQKFLDEQYLRLIRKVVQEINSDEHERKLKFVLFGSSATQLATDILVDVILGQGSCIRSTTGISDEDPDVPFLRPMREFSKKEIAFYSRAKNIQWRTQVNLLTKVHRKASIQTVTEAFLTKLHDDYPSTYNTLLKTGEKLCNPQSEA